MQKLMKKHNLSQLKVSEICKITQVVVSNWFSSKKNILGIKNAYFNSLYNKGYK